jgi:hypothetical protein
MEIQHFLSGVMFSLYNSSTILIEQGREYSHSFSVVTPCEAFASLSSHDVFDYRQKNPLKYCIPGSCYQSYE